MNIMKMSWLKARDELREKGDIIRLQEKEEIGYRASELQRDRESF